MDDVVGGPTVLVVEDDPLIASFVAKGLTAHGFRVEQAMTGSAAIARLDEGSIDIMLLDLGLPDVGGLELMPLLADRGTSVPTIVLTARSDPRDRAAAFRHGAHDYLMKPLTAATVVRAVRACLAHHPRSG